MMPSCNQRSGWNATLGAVMHSAWALAGGPSPLAGQETRHPPILTAFLLALQVAGQQVVGELVRNRLGRLVVHPRSEQQGEEGRNSHRQGWRVRAPAGALCGATHKPQAAHCDVHAASVDAVWSSRPSIPSSAMPSINLHRQRPRWATRPGINEHAHKRLHSRDAVHLLLLLQAPAGARSQAAAEWCHACAMQAMAATSAWHCHSCTAWSYSH